MTKLIETKLIYINLTFSNFVANYTLGRTEEVERAYTEIRVHYTQHAIDPALRLQLEKLSPVQKMWITHNQFPHDLPSNIKSYLVWVEDGTESEVKQLVFAMFPTKKVVCIFKNLPKDQSIKNLKHYHVFVVDNLNKKK